MSEEIRNEGEHDVLEPPSRATALRRGSLRRMSARWFTEP